MTNLFADLWRNGKTLSFQIFMRIIYEIFSEFYYATIAVLKRLYSTLF